MREWSTACCALVAMLAIMMLSVAMAVPYQLGSGPSHDNLEEQALDSDFDLNDKPITSQNSYLTWLRYLLKQNKNVPFTREEKRFTEFSVPYFKYRQDKRNDGIWIWMPAQGYVSVPKQQQAMENDANGKPGKIMRYGK